MKSIKLTFLFALLFSIGVNAQTKAVEKVVISTPTVQCDMCKNKIEKTLSRYDGVNAVNVNVKKHTTTVTYVTARTNTEQIKANIANAGYDADDVAANPEAYNKLSACCKKPEKQ